jgi:selenocysteine lyase/cysteine desulfurase
MSKVRDRFYHVDRCPVTQQPRIFFENGGGSLKLKDAIAVSADVEALPDQEGRKNKASTYLSSLIAQGRRDLHLQFGTQGLGDNPGQIISGETGTRLLYRIIRSIALSAPGGSVLSCNLEHPASLDAAKQWAASTGRKWIEVKFDSTIGTVKPENYAAAVMPDTRIATVIDLPGIAEAIRRVSPDCFIIVDGIQHAPHGALTVDAYGVDAYIFSPYKAYSRLSLGFAWINNRVANVPHEHMLGGRTDVWELGSRDPAVYAAQSKVVDYVCWLGGKYSLSIKRGELLAAGMSAISRHEAALVHLLMFGDGENKGLTDYSDITLVGPAEIEGREGIVSFSLRGSSAPDLVQKFSEFNIRVHARVSDAYSGGILSALGIEDCLRVSLCHYNSPAEVRTFLSALADINKKV